MCFLCACVRVLSHSRHVSQRHKHDGSLNQTGASNGETEREGEREVLTTLDLLCQGAVFSHAVRPLCVCVQKQCIYVIHACCTVYTLINLSLSLSLSVRLHRARCVVGNININMFPRELSTESVRNRCRGELSP